MSETKKEFESKLLKANSVEDVMAIMKEAGVETSAEEVQKTFEKVKERNEADGKELSLDELDAVAGGVTHRNWIEEGCAATVEPGSDCWGTDGGCTFVNINYGVAEPVDHACPFCGAPYTVQRSYSTNAGGGKGYYYKCRVCGKSSYKNKKTGNWEEYIW